MTDRIEAAARRYCELIGLDPDEGVEPGYPRWELEAHKIREAIAIQQALKETE